MSNISPNNIDEENPAAVTKPPRKLRGEIDGLGEFLFQLHSIHYVPSLLWAMEETTVSFYDQVVVATITRKLWCFPKSMKTITIPRFKIINATFTYGPKGVHWLVYLLSLLAIILILIGMNAGGCERINYSWYTYFNGSSCATAVIGFLILFLIVPLLLFIPCCIKKHHVYLDVKGYSCLGCCKARTITYDFRFKIIGFDTAASNKAAFDEFYLLNYVFGTLGKHGNQVMDNYHLLNHFHHVNLANPISPIHVDDSVQSTMTMLKASKVMKSTPYSPMAESGTYPAKHHSNSHARKRQNQQQVPSLEV